MQKYLQYDTLKRNDLIHFDSWASTFGETVTAIELAPEGTGYRAKTRFAKFYNLPELMSMFKECADIQTADMLNLPVPKANYHNVVLMQTLFALEDRYKLKLIRIYGETFLCVDALNGFEGEGLNDLLDEWQRQLAKLERDEITQTEYDHWRYNFT